jgi:hypothetical protein
LITTSGKGIAGFSLAQMLADWPLHGFQSTPNGRLSATCRRPLQGIAFSESTERIRCRSASPLEPAGAIRVPTDALGGEVEVVSGQRLPGRSRPLQPYALSAPVS